MRDNYLDGVNTSELGASESLLTSITHQFSPNITLKTYGQKETRGKWELIVGFIWEILALPGRLGEDGLVSDMIQSCSWVRGRT